MKRKDEGTPLMHRCEGVLHSDIIRASPRCRNAGAIERDGRFYCKVHDPIAREEKAKKRYGAMHAKVQAKFAYYEREQQEQKLQSEAVEVLRAICDHGANADNLSRAHSVLDKLDSLWGKKAAS